MSRTLFRLDIPDAVRAENLDGRELTRRGFAVSKFAAESPNPTILVDNSEDFVTDYNAVTPAATRVTRDAVNRVITFTNGVTGIHTGVADEYVFIGWKIIVGTGAQEGNLYLPSGTTGANYYFINCDIVYRNLSQPVEVVGPNNQNAFPVGYSTENNADRAGSQYGDTAAASRSINSYGCSHSYEDDTSRFIRWSDLIDSEIVFLRNFGRVDSSGNGRQIRSSITRLEGNAPYIIRAYGRTIIEDTVYSNFGFLHGNGGTNQPDQFVADRPRFMPTGAGIAGLGDVPEGQLTFFSFNIGQTRDRPIQLIGGPSLGNDANVVFGAVTGTAPDLGLNGGILRSDRVNRGYSGLNHYYGVGDRYFSDGAQTVGAAGVRVRLSGTINPGTVSSAATTLGGRAFAHTGADFINGNVSLIGQTNTDGRLSTHQYILGTAAPVDGSVNWWLWQPEPLQGLDIWAGNTDGTQSPQGMMLMPISRAYITNNIGNSAATADNAFNLDNITVTQERRSFAWDVNQAAETIAYPGARVNLEIPQNGIVINSLSGVRVKANYIDPPNNLQSAALVEAFPEQTTTGGTDPAGTLPASLNDIDNAFRSLWSDYLTDHTPDEDTTTLANNYNLLLNFTHDQPFSAATDGSGVTTLTVRSNSITSRPGDLFNTRRFNMVDLFNNRVADQDIVATQIRRPRAGNDPNDAAFSNCATNAEIEVIASSYFFDRVDPTNMTLTQASGTTGTTIIRGTRRDTGAALTADDFTGRLNPTPAAFDFQPPAFTLTVSPDVTEQDLQARGGFWRVIDDLDREIQSVTIDGSTTLADVTYSFFSGGREIRAWYQPGCTVGGYVAGYGYTLIPPTGHTANRDYRVAPADYTALANETSTDRTSTVEITATGSGATSGINVEVMGVGGAGVDRIWGQEIAIAILNNQIFIDAVVARELGGTVEERPIVFQQPFVVQYNGGLVTRTNTMTGMEETVPRLDMINLFVEGTNVRGINSSEAFLSTPPSTSESPFVSTTIIQQTIPMSEAIAAVENSPRLQQIDNKTSYMVTNGAATNAPTTGSRLTGLQPKRVDYGPDNDYTTNTRPTS